MGRKWRRSGIKAEKLTALSGCRSETSVADRRKMFELAASVAANGLLPGSPSRPDLRQAQQEALAEYVVRKKALRREEGSWGPRPRSAYLAPEGGVHTGGWVMGGRGAGLP